MESFSDQAEVIVCSINKDTKEATVENFLLTMIRKLLPFANFFDVCFQKFAIGKYINQQKNQMNLLKLGIKVPL